MTEVKEHSFDENEVFQKQDFPEEQGIVREYEIGYGKPPKEHQYQPGESGNPGGVPGGKSITAELRKLIDKGTNAEDVAQVLYDIAMKGSRAQVEALKELLNRTDGKVPDTHKIESDVPIIIQPVVYERREDATK